VLDAQSVKTAEGGAARGLDAGKKVTGRKRHLLVDTLGLLLICVVHAALVQDRAGGRRVLAGARGRFPLLGKVWADGGYANDIDASLLDWAREQAGLDLPSWLGPRGSGALRCCRAAGWWSAPSRGWGGQGGWPATTNANLNTPRR
jgi:hypothetical protein